MLAFMANELKNWTERGLIALTVDKRTDFRDPKTEGLFLRVGPSGSKSWSLGV